MRQSLHSEADQLLNDLGLLSILRSYGQPTVTGSCYLDLMVWRDLDLYVSIDQFSRPCLYELLGEVCSKFQPRWIEAKEEKEFPPGCKRSFFLGFETEIVGSGLWNVDIWFVDDQYIADRQAYLDRIRSASDETKEVIYRLKQELFNSLDYGQTISSIDIYNSVLYAGVSTVDELRAWIEDQRGRVD